MGGCIDYSDLSEEQVVLTFESSVGLVLRAKRRKLCSIERSPKSVSGRVS